jgi:serine/threonine protein kinase
MKKKKVSCDTDDSEAKDSLAEEVPGWPPRKVGEYRLEYEIGRGGMGWVFRAKREPRIPIRSIFGTAERFAVKILDPALAKKSTIREWFFGEGEVLEHLDHKNIVRLKAMDHDDGSDLDYLVMEYVEYEDGKPKNLAVYLQEKGGRLSPDEARDIVLQVCEALKHAHNFRYGEATSGVIHGDLKPENILLERREKTSFPKVKVFDFAVANMLRTAVLARMQEESSGRRDTEDDLGGKPTGQFVASGASRQLVWGTLDYMAPEQKHPRPGTPIDHRADIYALGRITYRVLTGGFPEHILRSPHGFDPEIPESWDGIVGQCLKEDPRDRFSSVQEIVDIIDREMPAAAPTGLAVPPTAFPTSLEIIEGVGEEMVTIERGELPGRPLAHVPPFRIDRRPVSKVLFSKFAESGAYDVEEGPWPKDKLSVIWTNDGLAWLQGVEPRKPPLPDRALLVGEDPVTGVSWFEAIAFCNWRTVQERGQDWLELGARLLEELVAYKTDGTLNPHAGYRLPSEAEMGFAANSSDFRGRAKSKQQPGFLEWCATSYWEKPFKYVVAEEWDPIGFRPGLRRLARNFSGTRRFGFEAGERSSTFRIGFRCANESSDIE